ncbi:MAG: hypothetical protein ACJAYX_004704 [Planctomycetota bacterium]|jgi:hypothetical protein
MMLALLVLVTIARVTIARVTIELMTTVSLLIALTTVAQPAITKTMHRSGRDSVSRRSS